ncbi:MAG: ATP phosphoribosyltransferase, partial [Alphaproteobacteria bacterium]|nr:ATP phosphoribosyltransferase [Alphaproteobacteria bacterium]
LSASEIVSQLASGNAHLGVTGEDLVRETVADADARFELLSPLGFGHANVVVAVPKAWIDVRSMADLEDAASAFRARRNGQRMRVATKYVNLTRRFFAANGVSDYRIVESLGATEGAPAAGQAELIVDITTTGATLEANALKVLDDGVMLRSEANLVASLTAGWSEKALADARALLTRISAEEDARMSREVRAYVPNKPRRTIREAEETFGARAIYGMEGDIIRVVCPAGKAAGLAGWLIGRGAQHVSVSALDYIFSAGNPLYDRLAQRLGHPG